MSISKKLVIAAVVGVSLIGCKKQNPIHPTHYRVMPLGMSHEITIAQIGDTIKSSAKSKGWSCSDVESGKLACNIAVRGIHEAEIELAYNKKDYAINLVSFEGKPIKSKKAFHKTRRWITQLAKVIDKNLRTDFAYT